MTHTNDAQTVHTARLDQYVNHDPRLVFKARLLFKEIRYAKYGAVLVLGILEQILKHKNDIIIINILRWPK